MRLDTLVGSGADWVIDRVAILVGSGTEMPHSSASWAETTFSLWSGIRSAAIACRVELDAAMFLLFGIARADVEYIMETFPIVKRKDEAAFGSYRTKELILDVYDAMQAAIDDGCAYQSPVRIGAARTSWVTPAEQASRAIADDRAPARHADEPRAWVIRAGSQGEAESSNLALGRASIGWAEVPDMSDR